MFGGSVFGGSVFGGSVYRVDHCSAVCGYHLVNADDREIGNQRSWYN